MFTLKSTKTDVLPGIIHAQHHQIYVSYAFGAVYAHWLESFFLDIVSFVLANYISGMTVRQSMVFSSLATWKTISDHCGYVFPWDPFLYINSNGSRFHDLHHQSWGLKVCPDSYSSVQIPYRYFPAEILQNGLIFFSSSITSRHTRSFGTSYLGPRGMIMRMLRRDIIEPTRRSENVLRNLPIKGPWTTRKKNEIKKHTGLYSCPAGYKSSIRRKVWGWTELRVHQKSMIFTIHPCNSH